MSKKRFSGYWHWQHIKHTFQTIRGTRTFYRLYICFCICMIHMQQLYVILSSILYSATTYLQKIWLCYVPKNYGRMMQPIMPYSSSFGLLFSSYCSKRSLMHFFLTQDKRWYFSWRASFYKYPWRKVQNGSESYKVVRSPTKWFGVHIFRLVLVMWVY